MSIRAACHCLGERVVSSCTRQQQRTQWLVNSDYMLPTTDVLQCFLQTSCHHRCRKPHLTETTATVSAWKTQIRLQKPTSTHAHNSISTNMAAIKNPQKNSTTNKLRICSEKQNSKEVAHDLNMFKRLIYFVCVLLPTLKNRLQHNVTLFITVIIININQLNIDQECFCSRRVSFTLRRSEWQGEQHFLCLNYVYADIVVN